MKALVLDVENTMYKHQPDQDKIKVKDKNGSAFCAPQRLVMTGMKWLGSNDTMIVNHMIIPKLEAISAIQNMVDAADIVIGFNIKHDLHWIRRLGVDTTNVVVRDCQIAEFLLLRQRTPYPSLNSACLRAGIPLKLDVVKEHYWEQGIDTDKVPSHILKEYLIGDLDRTEQVFVSQMNEMEVDISGYY